MPHKNLNKKSESNNVFLVIAIVVLTGLLWFLAGCGRVNGSQAQASGSIAKEEAAAAVKAPEEQEEVAEMEVYAESNPVASAASVAASITQPLSEMTEVASGSAYEIPSIYDTAEESTVINGGVPLFSDEDIARIRENGMILPELDKYGRCGQCFMIASPSTLTHEERGAIGHIRPSGWHTVKYPEVIKDLYLYNRAHLLAYSISGLLDDERNLITGTRQMNLAMLDYELQVLNYIENTGGSVYYRVTPLFNGYDLVAYGVLMEAMSAEDNGAGLQFCCVCWNKQDGVVIDYSNGDSYLAEDAAQQTPVSEVQSDDVVSADAGNALDEQTFIVNRNSGKFHIPTCESVLDMKEKNKMEVTGTIQSLESQGYSPCQRCLG